jgi:hypothetical protein
MPPVPSAPSLRRLQENLRAGECDLLSSLQALEAAAREQASTQQVDRLPQHDATTAAGRASERLRACLLERPAPYPAWAYLGYYRLGAWMLNGTIPPAELVSDWAEAVVQAVQASAVGPELIAFGDRGSASPRLWQELLELFQEGGDFVPDLEPPPAELLLQWHQSAHSARALIRAADPELEALMAELQTLLVLAQPGQGARLQGRGFGGATCFFFRGGSLLNSSQPITPIAMVERLVHEFAHAELFVQGQDEPLCDNGDEERHSVLIRRDPRPMNGILHALHVVSRVADLLRAMPDPEARRIRDEQLRFGASALQAVERHARLTPLGCGIVADARRRLDRAAAPAPSQP